MDSCGSGFKIASTDCDYLDALSPTEQRQVARVLGRTGDDGSYVLSRLDDPASRERFFELPRQDEMDGRDVKAMARMLRGDEEYVDLTVTADELVEIADRGADLSTTQMVVKRGSSLRWLEMGDPDEGGWLHISGRHISGSVDADTEEASSYFPLGQVVKGRQLPRGADESELKEMIYRSIKYGDETNQGRKIRYYFEPTNQGYPDSGIESMRVIVENGGSIETSYPLSGKKVRKWIYGGEDSSGRWEDEG